MTDEQQPKSRRGFATMDTAQQRAIASKGGKAAHAKGTAHTFTAAEAQAAGRIGGSKLAANREHMAVIGRKGGLARGAMPRPPVRRAEPPAPIVCPAGKPPCTICRGIGCGSCGDSGIEYL
jgi:general stress protein YciG